MLPLREGDPVAPDLPGMRFLRRPADPAAQGQEEGRGAPAGVSRIARALCRRAERGPEFHRTSMKIAVDALGVDFNPEKIISGAIDFARETRIGVVLVGKEDAVRAELDKHAAGDLPVTVHPASEVI